MAPWPFNSNDPETPRPTTAVPRPARPTPLTNRASEEDDEDANNPFIAFRRFADEQFRILSDGLSAVPTILSDLQTRGADSRWTDASFSTRAEQPLAFMSQHFETCPFGSRPTSSPAAPPPSSEAIAAARTLLVQARNANAEAGVSGDDVLALYRDDESGFDAPWMSVDWFRASPYSPAQLEVHRHCHQQGSMWRAAFEDLMAASLGKEMEARDAWTGKRDVQRLYSAWAQTPRDWMLGLQCRGVIPPQLPALYNLGHKGLADRYFSRILNAEEGKIPPSLRDFWDLVREVGTFDADEMRMEKPDTELDYYERMLMDHSKRAAASKEQQRSRRDEQVETRTFTEADVAKSKILSTLSTTERTTSPDGTVTTRVVLNKRFADGSEQSTETVSTIHASDSKDKEESAIASKAHGDYTQQQNGNKKGWFWF